MRPFAILPVGSVSEAIEALHTHGDRARLYAGGTELLLVMKQKIADLDYLIDIKHVPGLCGVTLVNGALEIGALTTHRELERSPLVRQHLPLLAEVESQVANIRVRSVGTIGGNLCFAEPHSDLGLLAVLLGATMTVEGHKGRREVAAAQFFQGPYSTVLEPGELLIRLTLPLLPPQSAHSYLRFRQHERPSVAAAVVLTLAADGQTVGEVRVAVGCAGPVPVRVPAAEAALVGRTVAELAGESTVARTAGQLAGDVAQAEPDFSGSAEYKTHLVGVYVVRGIQAAARRLAGGEQHA